MANTSGATVIFLQSHPTWVGGQRRARERSEAMRRHPSFLAQQLATVRGGGDIASGSRDFTVYSNANTPA